MNKDQLNNITKEELMLYPGIGQKISERIINNQPFRSWNELLEIPYVEEQHVKTLKEKKLRKSNPHGANDKLPDPRQADFLSYYLNPESETFSNCYGSAIRAGYAESYAISLSGKMPSWLEERVRDNDLVTKAMNNLVELLDEQEDKRLKWKASEFTLERLSRKKFGKNVDLTSQGERIKPELTDEQREKLIKELVKKYK